MHKNELAQLSANYWCVEAPMCVSKAHGFNKHLVAHLAGLLVYCRALKRGGHHSTAAQNWRGGERNSDFFFLPLLVTSCHLEASIYKRRNELRTQHSQPPLSPYRFGHGMGV